MGHVLAIMVALALYWALTKWLPPTVNIADLDSAIQLLIQVLAVAGAIMLVGVTVYASSHDISDTVEQIGQQLQETTTPFMEHFFERKNGRKLNTYSFRRLLTRALVDLQLCFYRDTEDKRKPYFVLRERWDGVWYWVHESPFVDLETVHAGVVQAYHEVVVMAHETLKHVQAIRGHRLNLVDLGQGTLGSTSFLKGFKKAEFAKLGRLPNTMTVDQTLNIIRLALYSEHYMNEEFQNHREMIDWEPMVATHFYLVYVDYLRSLVHLIGKLQLLRFRNVALRFPVAQEADQETVGNLTGYPVINACHEQLQTIHKRIVSVHGVARYFANLRQSSIPGIGTAVVALFLMLVAWPFIKQSLHTPIAQAHLFSTLYSLGVGHCSKVRCF
jgi:hypothetical protein